MTDHHCLSSLELLALKSTSASDSAREDLEQCPRCRALYAVLPEDVEARYEELLARLGTASAQIQVAVQGRLSAIKASEEAKTTPPHMQAPARSRTHTRTRVILFGQYLQRAIDEQDWDEVSLAERADITRNDLKSFLSDRFDLRFRRDADAVANVLKLIADDPEDVARGPLRLSLLQGTGGLVEAKGGDTELLAASSFAGVSDEVRNQDIHRDQIEVDESDQARERAAELYVAEVIAAL